MYAITKTKPEKRLTKILPKKSGRNNTGRITVRHQGGRQKRYYRLIDFRRSKRNVKGRIIAFEYDPNRNVGITLVNYEDGEKRYILTPAGLNLQDTVVAAENAEVKTGNALPLKNIPIGIPIHNLELHPGRGGQMVRGAGNLATILAKDAGFAQVKLPSGEVRMIPEECYATIGQLSNSEWKDMVIGSAGRARHMGRRPRVRGTAQHPDSHPHGGGEGRSGEGLKQPKTPWGKPARGLKTRKKGKYSNRLIIKRRK